MKTLKNCIKLSSVVKIYVPSTTSVKNEISNVEYVNRTLSFLSTLFNGATSSEAYGAWVSQNSELIKEKITLVFSYANSSDLEKNIEAIYDHCLNLKTELRQESIALEVNGELYLI